MLYVILMVIQVRVKISLIVYCLFIIIIEEVTTLTALRCVVLFFTTKNQAAKGHKADEMDIPFVLNEKIVSFTLK